MRDIEWLRIKINHSEPIENKERSGSSHNLRLGEYGQNFIVTLAVTKNGERMPVIVL